MYHRAQQDARNIFTNRNFSLDTVLSTVDNSGMMTEGSMDTDERIDAIARNVELLSGMQIETEKHLNQVIRLLASHEERLDDLEKDGPQ